MFVYLNPCLLRELKLLQPPFCLSSHLCFCGRHDNFQSLLPSSIFGASMHRVALAIASDAERHRGAASSVTF